MAKERSKPALRVVGKAMGKCPICKKDAVEAYRPFCSKRCADIDLGRWLTGAYVIAGTSAEDDDDAVPQPQKNATETGDED